MAYGKFEMTIQDWGSVGELVGAIATVATLVYLAIQIRTNTRIAKTSALQSMLAGDLCAQPSLTCPVGTD